MKLLALFVSGFAGGVAASWVYFRSMRATLKTYEAFIQDRLSKQLQRESEPADLVAANPSITAILDRARRSTDS